MVFSSTAAKFYLLIMQFLFTLYIFGLILKVVSSDRPLFLISCSDYLVVIYFPVDQSCFNGFAGRQDWFLQDICMHVSVDQSCFNGFAGKQGWSMLDTCMLVSVDQPCFNGFAGRQGWFLPNTCMHVPVDNTVSTALPVDSVVSSRHFYFPRGPMALCSLAASLSLNIAIKSYARCYLKAVDCRVLALPTCWWCLYQFLLNFAAGGCSSSGCRPWSHSPEDLLYFAFKIMDRCLVLCKVFMHVSQLLYACNVFVLQCACCTCGICKIVCVPTVCGGSCLYCKLVYVNHNWYGPTIIRLNCNPINVTFDV